MSSTPKLLERDVVARCGGLLIGYSYFHCAYCGRKFERGGKKEGFVKSGASNHVAQCRMILLMLAGYVRGDWITVRKGRMVKTGNGMSELRGQDGDHEAEPIDLSNDYHRRVVRALKASLAKRKRDGDVLDESLIRRRRAIG